MKQTLVATLLALTSILSAQTFTITAFDRPETYELSVDGEQEIRLVVNGVRAGDNFEIYLEDAAYHKDFYYSDFPADFHRLSREHLRYRATAEEPISICVEQRERGAATLRVTVRKNRPLGRYLTEQKGEKSLPAFTVINSNSMQDMLDTLFRNESCFEWDSVKLVSFNREVPIGNGPAQTQSQTGIFDGASGVFGMERGVILSTGYVRQASNDNTMLSDVSAPDRISFAAGSYPANNYTDSLARTMAAQPVDVVVLEFSFVPTVTELSFNYIFFSEEYCDAVGSNFNDAFKFLLSGPGIPEGGINIARLADGREVSVNTVNPTLNAGQFINNSPRDAFVQCDPLPQPSDAQLASIVYDGFTTKLTARGQVIPCEEYTLKLIVVDEGAGFGDRLNDTGVFLEAGSFVAGLISPPAPAVSGVPGVLTPVEGCDFATIEFRRLFNSPADLLTDQEVNYELITLAGIPLATEGLDFTIPAPPFIIPAGQSSATLTIPILADAEVEAEEAIILRYAGTCNCDDVRDTFFIQSLDTLSIDLGGDRTACTGDLIDLQPVVSGGNGMYVLDWDRPLTDSSRFSFPFSGADTTVTVDVTDGCGQQGTGRVRVLAPTASASIQDGFFSLCNQPTAAVDLTFVGTSPFNVTVRIDSTGGGTALVDFRITADTTLTFDAPATVTLDAVTDANGCAGPTRDTARIILPDFSIQPTLVDASCNGAADGSISLLVGGDNTNYTFAWRDAATALPQRTGLGAGTYFVSITDRADLSCTRLDSFTLTEPGALVISDVLVMPDTPRCAGEMFTLSPIVSGGTGSFSFNWSASELDSTLTVTADTGFHQFNVTVRDECGATRDTFFRYAITPFTADLGGRYSLCDRSSVAVPLSIDGPVAAYSVDVVFTDADGNETPETINFNSPSIDLPTTEAGSYRIVRVSNFNRSCSGFIGDTTALVVDPGIRFSAKLTDSICNGASTGRIELTGVSDVAVNFAWDDMPGLNSGLRTDLPAGTYRVVISDAADAGCSRDTTFSILAADPLTVAVTDPGATCPGEQLTLVPRIGGGVGPFGFDWANGVGRDSLFRFTTVNGDSTVAVRVTDVCGEVATAFVRFQLPDVRAEIDPLADYQLCNGPVTVTVNLSGAALYDLVIRENNVERTLTGLTGDIDLTYDDPTLVELVSVTSGCPGTVLGSADVVSADFGLVATVTDVGCRGGDAGAILLDLTGSSGPFTITWSTPGVSGPNPAGLVAGDYPVRILDDNGCRLDTTITIREPLTAITLVRDSLRDTRCDEDGYLSATYAGGSGTLRYAWTGGSSNPELGVVAPGVYGLTVTDDNGCEATTSYTIVDRRSTVTATVTADRSELNCANGTATLTAGSNVGLPAYSWSGPDGTTIGGSRAITVTAAGTYTVTVTDPANGCSQTADFTVTSSDDRLDLNFTDTYELNCTLGTLDLTVTTDHAGLVDYRWERNMTSIPGSAPTLTGISQTGTYTVFGIRRDNNCESSASVEVTENRVPPVAAVVEAAVSINCLTTETRLVGQPAGNTTAVWTTTDGNILSPPTDFVIDVDRAGSYLLTLTDTLNGCSESATVIVSQDGAELTADAGPDAILICSDPGTPLTAGFSPALPGTRTIWFDPGGDTLSFDQLAFATGAGEYTLEIIHPESGCSSFDRVLVTDEAPQGVTYDIQQPPCPEIGGSVTVLSVNGTNGPFTFSSPLGRAAPDGSGVIDLPSGTQQIIVTDSRGCTYAESFQIFDPDNFTGEADEVTVKIGETAQLGVRTNRPDELIRSYEWFNIPDTLSCTICPDPVVLAPESFLAGVIVTDTYGCEVEILQRVVVNEQELVYVPNAFSPNGDGVNDLFSVYGRREFVRNVDYLEVFDRWGTLVHRMENFPVNDVSIGWDGYFRDKVSPTGVYVWSARVILYDDTVVDLKGDLMLLR